MSALQLKLFDPNGDSSGPRLSEIYRRLLPRLPAEISKRSLVEHRTSLKHWHASTADPPVRDVTSSHLEQLRDYLIGRGLSPATINKVWRTLRSFFRFAVDELHTLDRVPAISHRSKARLVKEPEPTQRDTISHAEIERMWLNCQSTTYPAIHPADRVLLWRCFLVMAWAYGQRTHDLVRLPRSAILWNSGIVRWAADKTGKLQGLPLIPVVRVHLLRWLAIAGESARLFDPLRRAGHFATRSGRWSVGYYTTWRRELTDGLQSLQIKNFRQTMVTELNDLHAGVGGWAAGHSQPGVTERHYDQPTSRVRDAFARRAVPPCFLWGVSDEELRGNSPGN